MGQGLWVSEFTADVRIALTLPHTQMSSTSHRHRNSSCCSSLRPRSSCSGCLPDSELNTMLHQGGQAMWLCCLLLTRGAVAGDAVDVKYCGHLAEHSQEFILISQHYSTPALTECDRCIRRHAQYSPRKSHKSNTHPRLKI